MTIEARVAAILAEAAREVGVAGSVAGALTKWSIREVPFAVLDGGAAAEFHLDRVLASAARRTRDAAPSPRGEDWVRFSPPAIDQFAEDRLRAWFGAAHRRAAR